MVATQWRTGGLGGPTGLDYGAVESALRMRGTPRSAWPGLFEAVRCIERVMLDEFAQRASRPLPAGC